MNILFICSRNEWRSRTAETIFRNDPRFRVRSAGTSATARVRVNEPLIRWADVIFAMEDHHKQRLQEQFSGLLAEDKITVLDIPDEYPYLHPELVEELRDAVDHFLFS